MESLTFIVKRDLICYSSREGILLPHEVVITAKSDKAKLLNGRDPEQD